MAFVLDRLQRDAVYRFVLSDLAAVRGLAGALEEDEINRARWLCRNLEQATQLLDQIGWEKVGSRECYEVVLSAADALALFGRLYDRATRLINDSISEFANAVLKEAVCVAEVSGQVLSGHDPLSPHRPQLRVVEDERPG
jgi:hypothetical protein